MGKSKNETVEIFYGINPNTYKVEMVFLNRDGKLTNYSEDAKQTTHYVLYSRLPKTEILLVWGLKDLISFPPHMNDWDDSKRQVAELQQKAAAMKAAAEGDKDRG